MDEEARESERKRERACERERDVRDVSQHKPHRNHARPALCASLLLWACVPEVYPLQYVSSLPVLLTGLQSRPRVCAPP